MATSITPFGQTGPRRDLAATDIVNLAFSGLLYHSGDSDREPLRNALDQSLYVAGINGAVATTAALFHRWTTGRSSRVDVSVVECLASHLVQAVPYYNFMGAIKGRRPVRGSGFEELMPARDGYVIPSVQGSQPWSAVADLIGVPALRDERFSTGAGRIEFGEELNALLLEGLAQWDRKPLFQASGERRLVFGMAQDAGDLCQCPHLWERGFFTTVDHPIAGRADYPGMGPRLSSVPYQVRRPAPLLGQHNGEIYRHELGFTSRGIGPAKVGGGYMSGDPLAGIRVVDLSRVFAMPYCGAYLADMGAEVIKVETHHSQFVDTTRTLNGPYPDNLPRADYWERGGTFHTLNRGKLSLTLDLRSERALRLLRELGLHIRCTAGELHPPRYPSLRAGIHHPAAGPAGPNHGVQHRLRSHRALERFRGHGHRTGAHPRHRGIHRLPRCRLPAPFPARDHP